MERLTINIPDSKSEEIKGFLKSMGVILESSKKLDVDAYRKKIAMISIWSEEDLKVFDDNQKVFNQFKPSEW